MLNAMASNKTNGTVFNLGGTSISLLDIVKTMIKVNGKGRYKLVEYPKQNLKVEIGDYAADYSKFSELLDWQPKIGLEEGIRRTLAYYKKYKNFHVKNHTLKCMACLGS